MIALSFSLVDGRSAQDWKESVRTEPMGTNTQVCGILTFAILSHLSVVLKEGEHLGENHRNLVIPAAYVKGGDVFQILRDITLVRWL
jgi:hypothetical protein